MSPTREQVRELLGQTGAVQMLWMPTIKNLAYVVYENSEEAEATRCAAINPIIQKP